MTSTCFIVILTLSFFVTSCSNQQPGSLHRGDPVSEFVITLTERNQYTNRIKYSDLKTNNVIDLNEVPKSKVISARLVLANDLGDDLALTLKTKSCGCVSVVLPEKEIPAGQCGEIRFDIARGEQKGYFEQLVTVSHSADPNSELKFLIKGIAEEEVSLSNAKIALGRKRIGDVVSAKTMLSVPEKMSGAFAIQSVESDDPASKVTYEKTSSAGKAQIFMIDYTTTVGAFYKEKDAVATIRYGLSEEVREVTFSVDLYPYNDEDVLSDNETIAYGIVQKGSVSKKTITLANLLRRPISVSDIQFDKLGECFSCRIENNNTEKVSIEFQLQPPPARNVYTTSAAINFADATQKDLSVPISFIVPGK